MVLQVLVIAFSNLQGAPSESVRRVTTGLLLVTVLGSFAVFTVVQFSKGSSVSRVLFAIGKRCRALCAAPHYHNKSVRSS